MDNLATENSLIHRRKQGLVSQAKEGWGYRISQFLFHKLHWGIRACPRLALSESE